MLWRRQEVGPHEAIPIHVVIRINVISNNIYIFCGAIMADWTEAPSLNQSRSPYLLYRAVAMAWWIMNTLMGALSQSFDDEDAVNHIVRCVNKIQPINIINVALEG